MLNKSMEKSNFRNPLSEKRNAKLKQMVKNRQPNITVILENVLDNHNISAVVRSAESIGIQEMYILYTDTFVEKMKIGKRTSAGAKKWLNFHLYNDMEKCFEAVKAKYDNIYATHLGKSAQSVYDLDLSGSVALLFGNEHAGVSEAALKYCDGNFIIPQVGMTSSLNISVASAVTLYEAFRQRMVKGYYDENPLLNEAEQAELYENYWERSRTKQFNTVIHANKKT